MTISSKVFMNEDCFPAMQSLQVARDIFHVSPTLSQRYLSMRELTDGSFKCLMYTAILPQGCALRASAGTITESSRECIVCYTFRGCEGMPRQPDYTHISVVKYKVVINLWIFELVTRNLLTLCHRIDSLLHNVDVLTTSSALQ